MMPKLRFLWPIPQQRHGSHFHARKNGRYARRTDTRRKKCCRCDKTPQLRKTDANGAAQGSAYSITSLTMRSSRGTSRMCRPRF